MEQIIQIAPHAKILIASGYSAGEEIKASLEAGAKGFVRKPFEIKRMLNDVRRVLQRN